MNIYVCACMNLFCATPLHTPLPCPHTFYSHSSHSPTPTPHLSHLTHPIHHHPQTHPHPHSTHSPSPPPTLIPTHPHPHSPSPHSPSSPLTLTPTHPHIHSPSPPLTLTPPTQGYLFVSVIFGENHDLMPLVIQAIRLDLQSPNSVFKSLAMQCIANIGSKLMAAQIGPEIPPLLTAG